MFTPALELIAALLLVISVLLLRRYLHGTLPRTAIAPLETYPSVTLVCPIKGRDEEAERNLDSIQKLNYPGPLEILVVFDDNREPGLLSAMASCERSTKPMQILFSGEPSPHRTGKLNAMITGFQAARNTLVAFVDSDVRLPADALMALVETLRSDPRAGAAFAPVVVATPPDTPGDVGYASLLNGMYAPLARRWSARHNGAFPFIMGQFMVFTREALAEIGGLETADGQLVDDMYLGRRLHECGYKNLMSPRQVFIVQRGLSWPKFSALYTRWIAFSRNGLADLPFKAPAVLQAILFWGALVTAAVCLGLGHPWLAFGALIATLGIALDIADQHERYGGASLPLHYRFVPGLVLLLGPLLYLRVLLSKRVFWRGRVYELSQSSKLKSPSYRPFENAYSHTREHTL